MASIEQRKSNGKWQARIRRAGHPEQSKDFQTKEAAQQWVRAIERDMDIGKFIPSDVAETTTFEKAANRYVREILPGKKSVQQVQSAIKQLIEQFGDYALANVNAAMISAYCTKRLETVSAQTVVHDINILTRIFKAASIDWGIPLPQGIPTTLVRKPRVDGARDRRLEDGEWELLKNSLLMCESPYQVSAQAGAITLRFFTVTTVGGMEATMVFWGTIATDAWHSLGILFNAFSIWLKFMGVSWSPTSNTY